ncbi:hypothetical protein [Sinorhizobium fredii]|uniref:hypothetical protein n=1 Tax=Rhizobium fredii TaxID=380 RepID=UPI00055DDC03|nr:hypothetical protein [Sinorhizobium fredii]ASY73780.1 hypothetical protein SF83666_a41920 [Sinorhizobium fredii CCBAU 83666]
MKLRVWTRLSKKAWRREGSIGPAEDLSEVGANVSTESQVPFGHPFRPMADLQAAQKGLYASAWSHKEV